MKNIYSFDNKTSIDSFLLDHPLETFDAAVIGSSMAAASVASRLIKGNKKILVIEKGSFFDRAKESTMDIDSTFMPIKPSTREIAYGGTSNLWMGLISEFEEFEYTDRWSDKPKNLWGINQTELKKCSKQAWKLFGIKRSTIRKNRELESQFSLRDFTVQKKPFRSVSILNNPKIVKLLNSYAFVVGEDKKGSFVDIISMINEEQKRFYCKKIIVCCGGLDSTKLILNSIKENTLDLGSRSKFVGKYYMNHPRFHLGILKNNKNLGKKFGLKYLTKGMNYLGISLKEEEQIKNKLNNTYFKFSPVYQWKQSPEVQFVDILVRNKKFFLKNILDFLFRREKLIHLLYEGKFINDDVYRSILTLKDRNFLHLIFSRNLSKYIFNEIGFITYSKKYSVTAFLEMIPNVENCITVEHDSKKDNRINVSYKLSDIDKNTIDYLIKKLTTFASNYGLEFQPNEQIDYSNHEFFKDVAHHMGGTIIDSPSYLGTVDTNLKILGCRNIYICSSSIFPTSGSVNPNNTIVGLGLRLGNHLKSFMMD